MYSDKPGESLWKRVAPRHEETEGVAPDLLVTDEIEQIATLPRNVAVAVPGNKGPDHNGLTKRVGVLSSAPYRATTAYVFRCLRHSREDDLGQLALAGVRPFC